MQQAGQQTSWRGAQAVLSTNVLKPFQSSPVLLSLAVSSYSEGMLPIPCNAASIEALGLATLQLPSPSEGLHVAKLFCGHGTANHLGIWLADCPTNIVETSPWSLQPGVVESDRPAERTELAPHIACAKVLQDQASSPPAQPQKDVLLSVNWPV